jgi:hypothetical protein
MNRVTCLHCGTTITSRSVHDFRTCACEEEELRVSVDGGEEYQRRCYGLYAWWEEADGTRVGLCPLCGRATCPPDCPCAGKSAAEIVALTPKLPAYRTLIAEWNAADKVAKAVP